MDNKELLDASEKNWLNDYHKKVYETLNPLLNDRENKYLKEQTRQI